MRKQLRKLFSILCAIALLVSSIPMALAEETSSAEADAVRIAAEEEAARKAAEEAAAKKAAEEAARKAAEEEAARKAAEEAAAKKAAEEAARKAAEEEAARKAAEEAAARKAAEEEAARKAAEEEAARKAAEEAAAKKAAEEEAARKAAEEEAAKQAAEEEAPKQAEEETAAPQPKEEKEEAPAEKITDAPAEEQSEEPSFSNEETPAEENDGLVEIDDGWGYVDPEVISENTPEITDELKGLRKAELSVGKTLSDTIDFGDELTIKLKKSKAATIELRLLVPNGASINTKVDGKAVGFTPADSDDPSTKLYTYEIKKAAGKAHEIVLTSNDKVSFKLSAVDKNAENNKAKEEAPAAKESIKNTEKKVSSENTEAPVQASVKNYDAVKVGGKLSDTLVAGQKGKVTVKCGKNPYVTVTLKADADMKASIDGAEFVSAGNGTYVCELENVAFRKYNVTISAKQDLSFTLSVKANENAAQEEAKEEPVEEKKEEPSKEVKEEPVEEKKEEPSKEVKEEPAEEKKEEPSKEVKEEPVEEKKEEPSEEVKEEPTEEKKEEPSKEVKEEPAEEKKEEPSKEVKEEPVEEKKEETSEEVKEEPVEEKKEETSEEVKEEPVEEKKEEPSEEVTEEPAEEQKEEAPEEAVEEPAEEQKEEAPEEVTEEPAEEQKEEAPEEVTEEPAEEQKEEAPEEVTEEPAEEQKEEAPEEVTEEPAEEQKEEAPEEATEEPAEEQKEEVPEEVTEEPAEGTGEETAEEGTEEPAEGTEGENSEELSEEPSEETEEENGEETAETEETAEETEETAEESEETEESEEAEDEDEQMTAQGCVKVTITAEEGADLYAEASKESEVVGHLEAEATAWVILNEEQTWGQLYSADEEAAAKYLSMDDAALYIKEETPEETEEESAEEAEPLTDEQMAELGYRKVQVLNQNGTDIYDGTAEEAAAVGHADTGAELWIRDAEAEGWAQIYTEDETQQFIKLADLEKQMPTDEEMLAMGYIKVYVAIDIGANIYGSLKEEAEPVDHVDVGTEFWVKLIKNATRAQIYDMDENAKAQYINLVDIIAIMKPEGMEALPTREIVIHDVLKEFGMNVIFVGTEVPYELELINFTADDQYKVRWQYSKDGKEFVDIPDANELTFTYVADMENQKYTWKAIVELVTGETAKK